LDRGMMTLRETLAAAGMAVAYLACAVTLAIL
jgi:hypothetical protein